MQSKGLLIHSCWTSWKTDLLTLLLSHVLFIFQRLQPGLCPQHALTRPLLKSPSAPGVPAPRVPSVLLLLDLSIALNSADHTSSLKRQLLLVSGHSCPSSGPSAPPKPPWPSLHPLPDFWWLSFLWLSAHTLPQGVSFIPTALKPPTG